MALKLPRVIEDGIVSISEAELELRGWTREGMRRRYLDRMRRDLRSPQVGEEGPDFELELLNATGERTGELMALSRLRDRPVGLIFGSYTCPHFRSEAVRLDGIAKKFSDRVGFLCIYIKEAHPTDGSQASANLDDGVLFAQPVTEDERAGVAAVCMLRYSYSFPMVLDDMEDTVGDTYMAWPGRLYLLDTAGRVAWKCGLGPHFFDPDGFDLAIGAHIASLRAS